MENNKSLMVRTEESGVLMSAVPGTLDGKQMVNIAAGGASDRLSSIVGQRFSLAGFVLQQAEFLDRDTGELVTTPRITLIASDGRCFTTMSKGIMNFLNTLTGLYGMPDNWETAFEVLVKMRAMGSGNMFYLELV